MICIDVLDSKLRIILEVYCTHQYIKISLMTRTLQELHYELSIIVIWTLFYKINSDGKSEACHW